MAMSYASTVIDATADAVWAKIRDFNATARTGTARRIAHERDRGRQGRRPGRRGAQLHPRRDGTHLREKLLAHSDEKRFYTYDFQKTPFDVDNYNATIRVTPVTDGDKAFVEWWMTFDCDRDQQEHWTDFFANVIFQNGLESIKKRMRGE